MMFSDYSKWEFKKTFCSCNTRKSKDKNVAIVVGVSKLVFVVWPMSLVRGGDQQQQQLLIQIQGDSYIFDIAESKYDNQIAL